MNGSLGGIYTKKIKIENEREEILFEAVEGEIDDIQDLVHYIQRKGRRFDG